MISTSRPELYCPLCQSEAEWFCDYFNDTVDYFKCKNCLSIFKTSKHFPDPEFEKERYETHNNDVKDIRYQKFVSPITNSVKENFDITAKGLDFGCGTGPVAAYILEKKGYSITLYDPFFHPSENYKTKLYDFIICCEVMEHFFFPNQEFMKLKKLLRPDSILYCKTKMIPENFKEEDFKKWHYKNDPTHVFFYSSKTLEVIRDIVGFKSVSFDDNLIIFST